MSALEMFAEISVFLRARRLSILDGEPQEEKRIRYARKAGNSGVFITLKEVLRESSEFAG